MLKILTFHTMVYFHDKKHENCIFFPKIDSKVLIKSVKERGEYLISNLNSCIAKLVTRKYLLLILGLNQAKIYSFRISKENIFKRNLF